MTEKNCLTCGKPFIPKPNQKYCCEKCRQHKAEFIKEYGINLSKQEKEKLQQKWLEMKGANDFG